MAFYSIIISSLAQDDIASCIAFVMNVSKQAAIELKNDIFVSIETLTNFPERNATFSMPSKFSQTIRKLIVDKRYVVLYSIEGTNVVVYRIIDSRRQFDYLLQ